MRISYLVAGCAAAALLSGCGDPGEDANTNEIANTVQQVPVEAIAVVDYDLTPDQQARRDAVDMNAYRDEVKKYEDEDRKAGGSAMAGDDSATSAQNNMTASAGEGSSDGNMSASASGGSSLSAGANPEDVTFEELDRNDDGKLSVAEFAIYSIGLDAGAKKPNDQLRPYANDEQLNRAANGFFHFDTNGDTYLEPGEFAAAKVAIASGGGK